MPSQNSYIWRRNHVENARRTDCSTERILLNLLNERFRRPAAEVRLKVEGCGIYHSDSLQ